MKRRQAGEPFAPTPINNLVELLGTSHSFGVTTLTRIASYLVLTGTVQGQPCSMGAALCRRRHLRGLPLTDRAPCSTADTALRLACLFKMSPEFWMGLQADWDLWHAAHEMRKAV